jgi:hypothetical protein
VSWRSHVRWPSVVADPCVKLENIGEYNNSNGWVINRRSVETKGAESEIRDEKDGSRAECRCTELGFASAGLVSDKFGKLSLPWNVRYNKLCSLIAEGECECRVGAVSWIGSPCVAVYQVNCAVE